MLPTNIYDYITQEKEAYKTTPVPLADNWEWNMFDHVTKSFLYKNSKFSKGQNDGNRPFLNIVRPILNVAYRAEGFDVKDIVPFADDEKNYYKSFLIKKFHPRWARKHDINTFIDEMVESYVDYGLALIKNVSNVRPEVVPLQRLAFCDQTDILSGPICELHQYSVDQLKQQKWRKDKIDEAITMAEAQKVTATQDGKKVKTPSKYIEVYELHGTFPQSWLSEGGDPDEYVPQMHIVTFYTDEKGNKHGITLFDGEEKKQIYKAIKRDPIYGRACGFGGVEELFEPQTWTNYSEIQLKEMLDVAALIILQTSDKKFEGNNVFKDMEKGEIVYSEDGKPLTQVSITPQNKAAFDASVEKWQQNARTIGSADEALLGENPTSGTPFALQALVTTEGKGLHEYRQGKLATFTGEIYRDWGLGYLVKEMNEGQKFADELTADELEEVVAAVVRGTTNQKIKDKMLQGQLPTAEEKAMFEEVARLEFLEGGRKRFFEIIKDEFKDIPVDVEVNIVGKQKDLAERADKLTNIFRAVIANPQVLQAPGMGKLFNEIIEASGFSAINFAQLTKALPAQEGAELPSPVEEETVPA